MKMLLVDFTKATTIKVVDIDNDLSSYYETLGCSAIDIKSMNDDYDLIFDDEFLFKLDSLEVGFISKAEFLNGLDILGPFLVCRSDGENELDVGDIEEACFMLGASIKSAGKMRRRRQ